MKSAHLTNAWHSTSGGIATHYRSLLLEAEKIGRHMVLIVPGETDGLEERQTTRIYTVASRNSLVNPSYRNILPNRWPGVHSRVREIILKEQPDLIEICDKYTLHYLSGSIGIGLFKGLHKKPVLIGMSCERMDDNLGVYLTNSALGKAFARWYMKWIYYGFFDHHIANSEHVAEELRLASIGHDIQRGIWVRPPGVDLTHFRPENRTPNHRHRLESLTGGKADSRILLYAGRLAPEKNLQLLIDTFDLLHRNEPDDYRLIVAGEGMSRHNLEAQASKRFSGKAFFMGHVKSREELATLMANCDVFVHSNPAEPFGIAPLEAMASRIPFVGPRSGGLLTYAGESNSWLANPDPHAFAKAIIQSFTAADRDAKLNEAIRTAARFNAPQTARNFLNLYADFVSKGIAPEPNYLLPRGSLMKSGN